MHEFYLNQIPSHVKSSVSDQSMGETIIYIAANQISHSPHLLEDAKKPLLLACVQGELTLFAIGQNFDHGDSGDIFSGKNLKTDERVAIKRVSGDEIPSGWGVVHNINSPAFIKVHALGAGFSLDMKSPKGCFEIMEKGAMSLNDFHDKRRFVGAKRLLVLAMDLLEISISIVQHNVRWGDLNSGHFVLDASNKHVKMCDHDGIHISPDYYSKFCFTLWFVYDYHFSHFCYEHWLKERYSQDMQKYIDEERERSVDKKYLKHEHISRAQEALAEIDSIDKEAKEYLHGRKIELNNVDELRKEFQTKIGGLIKRFEFQRIKFRNPYFEDEVIHNFLLFREQLGSSEFEAKALETLISGLPPFLFQMEGASVMEVLLEMHLPSLLQKSENVTVLQHVLSLINPPADGQYNAEHGYQCQGQWRNNNYIREHYDGILRALNMPLEQTKVCDSSLLM